MAFALIIIQAGISQYKRKSYVMWFILQKQVSKGLNHK